MSNHIGNQKPTEALKGHWTKAQLEERKSKELQVKKLTKSPSPPQYLNDNQKKIFKKTCKQLIEAGLLTELDIDTVVQYSISLDMYIQITEMINSDSKLLLDTKLLNKQLKLLDECRKCQNLLCLNVISRSKIVVNNVEKEVKENKFNKFIKSVDDNDEK